MPRVSALSAIDLRAISAVDLRAVSAISGADSTCSNQLFREDVQPLPFCYAVRRSPKHRYLARFRTESTLRNRAEHARNRCCQCGFFLFPACSPPLFQSAFFLSRCKKPPDQSRDSGF